MIKKLWRQLVGIPHRPKVNLKASRKLDSGSGISERDLIAREAEIGSEIFGPIPEGHQRKFFCLDEATWLWHESWVDSDGKTSEVTIRYKVHSDKVLKSFNGTDSYLDGQELDNFKHAVRRYTELVARNIYNTNPEQQTA